MHKVGTDAPHSLLTVSLEGKAGQVFCLSHSRMKTGRETLCPFFNSPGQCHLSQHQDRPGVGNLFQAAVEKLLLHQKYFHSENFCMFMKLG